jgi:hypothetical protein
MFFHFEEVVGVGEAWKGLQRPCVKHLGIHTMVRLSSPQNVHVSKSDTSPPCPSSQGYDVKLKSGTFCPSWENRLVSNGWARSSKASSRLSKSSLSHLACGPLTSNLACSPMEAQARFVLPKLSTSYVQQRQMNMPSKDLKS